MIENYIKTLKYQDYDFNKNLIIFDIGSRDCKQSIEFNNIFPNAKIYAFECNPNTLPLCKENIKNYERITLIDKAVNNYNGKCKFYPINPQKTITTWEDGNPGASSLFVSNGKYPNETYIQDEIEIDCIRIDDIIKQYDISKVDLIWMDAQGAELLALESFGTYLQTVDFIYTEVSYQEMYTGQVLFNELHNFLINNNFLNVTTPNKSGWQEDIIYKNNNC
jgi:FkbM family methyltransferase